MKLRNIILIGLTGMTLAHATTFLMWILRQAIARNSCLRKSQR